MGLQLFFEGVFIRRQGQQAKPLSGAEWIDAEFCGQNGNKENDYSNHQCDGRGDEDVTRLGSLIGVGLGQGNSRGL